MRIIFRFVLAAAALASVWPAFSEDLPEGMVAVRYGFEIDGWKPVTGEAFCALGKDCRLGFDFDPVRVILRLAASGEDKLEITCPDHPYGCSLGISPSKSFAHSQRSEGFSIFGGKGQGLSKELVLRYQQKIGMILLSYRVPLRPLTSSARGMTL